MATTSVPSIYPPYLNIRPTPIPKTIPPNILPKITSLVIIGRKDNMVMKNENILIEKTDVMAKFFPI